MTPGQTTLLPGVAAAAERELLRGATTLELSAGDEVPGGEQGSEVVGIVLSGLVRTYVEEDERQQTIRYLRAGALLGVPLLYGRTAPLAQCVTDARIVRLVPDTVRALMRVDAAIANAMADGLVEDLDAATRELALASFRTIRARVAHQLLLRALVAGPVLDVTQRDIARTVGSVREVVGRAMQDLERTGAVRRREDGNLELDLDALKDIREVRRRG